MTTPSICGQTSTSCLECGGGDVGHHPCHTDHTVSPGSREGPAPAIDQHADVLLDPWVEVIILVVNVVLVAVVVTALQVDQH